MCVPIWSMCCFSFPVADLISTPYIAYENGSTAASKLWTARLLIPTCLLSLSLSLSIYYMHVCIHIYLQKVSFFRIPLLCWLPKGHQKENHSFWGSPKKRHTKGWWGGGPRPGTYIYTYMYVPSLLALVFPLGSTHGNPSCVEHRLGPAQPVAGLWSLSLRVLQPATPLSVPCRTDGSPVAGSVKVAPCCSSPAAFFFPLEHGQQKRLSHQNSRCFLLEEAQKENNPDEGSWRVVPGSLWGQRGSAQSA